MGYTGIALSVDNYFQPDYDAAGIFGARLAECLGHREKPLSFALNINCPSGTLDQIRGVRITRQGDSRIMDNFVQRTDPRGITYYWQAGMTKVIDETEDTDAVCLRNKMISVTPIYFKLGCQSEETLAGVDLEGLLHAE